MTTRAALTAAVIALTQPHANAQTFAAAAIHESRDAGENQSITAQPGGRVLARNVTLRTLTRVAFDVAGPQVDASKSAPKWLDSAHFDVDAVSEARTESTLAEMRPQLRQLLAERFGLQTHSETRELQSQQLTPAKSGLRIRPSEATAKGPIAASRRRIDGDNVTMQQLAQAIASATGWPTADNTGFSGLANVHIAWTPEGEEPREDSPPSLQTVLEVELGIRLTSRKTPTQVIAIDAATKPNDN